MASKFLHYAKNKQQKEIRINKRKNPKGIFRDGSYFENRDEILKHRRKCIEYLKEHGDSDTSIDGRDCPDKWFKKHNK